MQRLTEVASTVAADLAPFYADVLGTLVDELRADQAALSLFDPDGVIRVVATHRLLETFTTAAEGNCPWDREARDVGPMLVPDVLSAAPGSLQNVVAAQRTRAVAIFPLVSSGRLLGTFTAYFDGPRGFDA